MHSAHKGTYAKNKTISIEGAPATVFVYAEIGTPQKLSSKEAIIAGVRKKDSYVHIGIHL